MNIKENEMLHFIAAIIILTAALFFPFALKSQYEIIPQIFIFSILLLGLSVISKKIMAFLLDASVTHNIWQIYRFGLHPTYHFKKEIPAGIIIPFLSTIITLGKFPFLTILTYETRILKRRAARRFGAYSYTEMTDFHNAVIGSAGIITALIITVIGYLLGYELLASYAAFYALTNLIPISNLDGSQIFFGSRVFWSVLTVIALIFLSYSIAFV